MIERPDTHDEQVRAMDDRDLRVAYERTDGEPGNPEADALLAEIKRRGLDT
jgi:hypothetical protein